MTVERTSPARVSVPEGRGDGRVEAIYIAPSATAAVTAVPAVEAAAGQGLVGDRYAAKVGTYSDRPGTGRHLTFIAGETLEALAREAGITLAPGAHRRNVVTRGADLDALIGKRFRVGTVECLGMRRCQPCAHLEGLTRPGVLKGLVDRGGLRADIVSSGRLAVGDAIVELGEGA